jgi:hypothetical protein
MKRSQIGDGHTGAKHKCFQMSVMNGSAGIFVQHKFFKINALHRTEAFCRKMDLWEGQCGSIPNAFNHQSRALNINCKVQRAEPAKKSLNYM